MNHVATQFAAAPSAADISAETMRFVQQLGIDVSGPPLELPSYPVVALRVQRILMDPDSSNDRVIRLVGSDPVLAARITTMASSAALNRSGKAVADLRAAVSRLGFDALRAAAITFAISQLRNAAAYRPILDPMKQLWQSSVRLGALSFVLARHSRRVTPDSALLAGLVSCMGKLYILTRSGQYPALFADPASYDEMVHGWHAQVARSILENWQLAPEVIDAVACIDEAALDERGRVTLADVLSCAQLLIDTPQSGDTVAQALADSHAAQRLELTSEACAALLAESAAEQAQLRQALAT